MKKKGLAKFGQVLSNAFSGHICDYEYTKKRAAFWYISEKRTWILKNVKIVDVDLGCLRNETAVLIKGERIIRLVDDFLVNDFILSEEIINIVDGENNYLIPGLSDIHCHLALVSEHDSSSKALYYADAQRMRNCEFALESGCTFVRTSGGAYEIMNQLINDIEEERLLGPKIMPSYIPLIPKGGMWDINPLINKFSTIIFGGKLLRHINGMKDLEKKLGILKQMKAESIKIYLEDKPLYGKNKNEKFKLFTKDQLKTIREFADKSNKPVEAHAMFIKGAKLAIETGVDSLAHLTVDEPYSLEDAMDMVKNDMAIVPTLGIGSFLSMNCGKFGYPDSLEYKFYQRLLISYVTKNVKSGTIFELLNSNLNMIEEILDENENRKMPLIGDVYPERVHGFAVHAPESFKNFRLAGTKIGVGTDGGTGVTWSGALNIEFAAYKHYGFTPAEILRMATLGNMEILKLDKEMGSIEEGKYADMVLLKENPLESIEAIESIQKVFKNGRCYVDKSNTCH